MTASAVSEDPVKLGSRSSRALFAAGACLLVGTAAGLDPRAGVAALAAVGVCLLVLHRPTIAAFTLVAVVPATSGLRPGLPIPGLRLSELMAGGVAGLLLVIAEPGRTPPWRAFDWLALGYVVATALLGAYDLLALGTSIDLQEASRLLGPLQFFLLYRALLTTLTSADRRRTAIRILLLASVPVSLLALLQAGHVPGVTQFLAGITDSEAYADVASSGVGRATGPFPHWHDLGGYLFVVILLGVSLLVTSQRALERRTLLAVIGLAAMAAVSTVSFTPIAGAIAGSLWLLVAARRFGRWLGGLAAFFAVLSLIFAPVLEGRYHEQFATPTPVKERPFLPQNVNFRIDVWTKEFVPVVRRHILTGYGPDLPPGLGFTYTETIYVTLLLRGGLPLLLLYGGLMIAAATRGRELKHAASPERRAVARTITAVVVLIAFMQMMTNYFVNAGFPHVFWILAALLFARDRVAPAGRPPVLAVRAPRAIPFGVSRAPAARRNRQHPVPTRRPSGARTAASSDEMIRSQVRGSSLLLVGRVLQLGVNMVVQLLVVRYLSKEGYGAFAYALAIVMLGETIVLFGLDRAVSRLMPIALEKRDYAGAFGVLALSMLTVVSLGALLTVAVVASRGVLGGALIADHRAVTLLALMIVLSPIQALEDLLVGMFGVLAKPRTIFVRTYVIAPILRLAVGVLLIATHSSVYFLAAGYVLTGAAGLAISLALLVAILRREGLLEHFNPRRLRLPFRSTFAFTLPLLSTDLVNVLLFSSDAVLLGHFRGAAEVASFRVVIPVVSLILVPASVFTLLYVPLASRLFARGDRPALTDLYWRTTLWIAVACFPMFALSLCGAGPLTSLLYGSRYADSAIFLSLLAVGYYFQAALGFSGLTLMVVGRVRFLTVLNVAAMVVNVALNFILIPAYGALGAAIGTTITLIAYNLLKQLGLRARTGIRLLAGDAVRPLVVVGVAGAALMTLHPLAAHRAGVGVTLAVLASAAVFAMTYRSLDVTRTFPELSRLPGIRRPAATEEAAS